MSKKSVEKGFLSGYLNSISDNQSKERYCKKLELIESYDPYEIPKKEWKDDVELWPAVTYIDVGMYLLFSKSSYTEEQLKNYKSLNCYQNFVYGWVRNIFVKDFGERRLLIAKVNHSMRMTEKPLTPWVICHKSGKVVSAHCDCMAGLGESCSHVASLLWAVEAGVKKRNSLTVTDKKAYWVLPSAVKKVPYAKISKINFSKYGRANKLRTESKVPVSSQAEIIKFLRNVKESCSSKPAVMSLMKEFSDSYVPSSLDEYLPPVLSTYFDKKLLNLDYDKALSACEEKLFIYNIDTKHQIAVEEKTRKQSNSRLWFRMRTGRVTASKLKAACSTNPLKPSHSLIMSVCHPELVKFSNDATRWGCSHEENAKEAYFQFQKSRHQELKIEESGFFISTEYGFLGATPDVVVSCKCCGKGVLETKCPFCQKDKHVNQCMQDKNFCLESTRDGKQQLKHNHAYFYQVQAQMFCSGYSYCDFIVWTERSVHVERILPNASFMEKNVAKVKEFATKCLLPEILATWYYRPVVPKKLSGCDSSRDD